MCDLEDTGKFTRIAIINKERCKPAKCSLECKKKCPVENSAEKKVCIDVNKQSKKAIIAESICIGCGMCVRVCPFGAIKIVNVPTNINKEIIHRFGPNTFKLHRLPMPKRGQIVGIVGSNGLGKSTILNILGNKIAINFGDFMNPPDLKKTLDYFRGSELQDYFKMKKKVVIKQQFVDLIPKFVARLNGITDKEFQKCGTTVMEYIKKTNNPQIENILEQFQLNHLANRDLNCLSGGELQRFACAYVCASEADVYMFDEFTSFLDIKQRLSVSDKISNLCRENNYLFVVDHDLSILDYLSDSVCILYGEPAGYGIVSAPFGVGHGINIYLNGYLPTDNLRFRDEPFVFDKKLLIDTQNNDITYKYSTMTKTLDEFKLVIEGGEFTTSNINVLLGENGVGKTTFIKLLSGTILPDTNGEREEGGITGPFSRGFVVSYKPQNLKSQLEGRVSDLIGNKLGDPTFISQVLKPIDLERLLDKDISNLSGGELQKVMIALCLSKNAEIYLIDEPSAYLDAESRIIVSKILKRFIANNKKIAFVVEHDMLMVTYLADKIIVFDGVPGIKTVARKPDDVVKGMNLFLENIGITLRRDTSNNRPRINKKDSVKDKEQKQKRNYYLV